MSDINQKLTERPGGFGGIMKAKAKKQLSPFMKGKQQGADDEVRLIKVAREIKKDLKAWMTKAFRSSGGAKAPLTMNQFLGWVKKAQPKYAKGIETYARGDSSYADHFTQNIDKDGKQTSTGKDDKVKRRPDDGKANTVDDEKVDTVDDSQDQEDLLSPEDMTGGDQGDLFDEKGEEKKPESNTSASIYEARLRAILEAEGDPDTDVDVGVDAAQPLKDNQIDTLITMGIEKQIELDGGESIVDDPSEVQGGSSGGSSGGSESSNLDSGDIENLKVLLDDLGDDIFAAIRNQDGIEQDVKKQLASTIQSLVDDIAQNSF